MATTIGRRLTQQTSHRAPALATAATAVVLACAVGLAIFISQAPATSPGPGARAVSQVHATGRGFQPGTGSYTTSLLTRTSQASGYAAGRGGLMEHADLELPAAAVPVVSQPRGGVLESARVR